MTCRKGSKRLRTRIIHPTNLLTIKKLTHTSSEKNQNFSLVFCFFFKNNYTWKIILLLIRGSMRAYNKTKKSLSFIQKIQNIINIPISIRRVSISLFLFMMGRGLWGDTFFSIYIKEIIGTGIGLTLIGAFLPIIKLGIVIPIGVLNDQGNAKYLLLWWKILYAICAIFYFAAGINHSISLLLIAVLLNGIASSTMFTTYRVLYGKKSKTTNRSQIFGVYFSSINMAYVIGAIISSFLVKYLDLPYMYLFVVIFALFSILQDGKIQDFIRRNFSKTRKRFSKKQDSSNEVNEDILTVKKVLGKKGVVSNFFKEVFSLNPWKKMFSSMRNYGAPMYIALSSQAIVNFVNYVGFLFIPLVAIENTLSLSEIAILFAVMRIPYLVNVFIGNLGDKYNKKILISLWLLVASGLFVVLGTASWFLAIVGASFWLSLIVALLQPISSALILWYAKPQDKGLVVGMQEFVSKSGEMIGSLGFGILTARVGMHLWFQILGLALWVLSAYLLIKKLLYYNSRDQESQKEIQAQIPLFVPKTTDA